MKTPSHHAVCAAEARTSRIRNWLWIGLSVAMFFVALAIFAKAEAAPPAGASIGNQASATYSDASEVTRTVTSNTVTTIVQQVASVSLTADGAKNSAVGGQVYYPHTLTNTGNGIDSFALSASNSGGFTFTSVQFYADANGDGVPDNNTAITNTGELTAAGVFKFIVAAVVPTTAVAGSSNTLTLTATSSHTASTTASNTDTTTVSDQAVINVTKAMDVTSGASPAGPRTITLTYTNTGNTTATALTLADLLPSGMTYVANSARWSVTGSGVVLTDTDNTDNQSGVVYDFGITTSNRITAVIATVAPGTSGTLTFQVNINAGLAPGANAATANTASYSYNDGAAQVAARNTNTVQYTVTQVAAVAISGSTIASAPQGSTVSFTNPITNNGNGLDSFDITLANSTFPAGTTFQLFQADGVTPLVDSNGDGIADTGPLAAGATYNVVVKAILPSSANDGPHTVQPTATSHTDSSKSSTTTDTLNSITPNAVDLTNNTAGSGAPGAGAGPEDNAVIINSVNPGETTRFTLVVANSSTVADTFDLLTSIDASFATASLPTNWRVVFKDTNGATISNTGVIGGNGNKTIYADVSVPADAIGTTDLYFRALSPTSNAGDFIHDAVAVNTVRNLSLTPNHSGQVTAGGTIVYSHVITNTGNVLEGDGVASTVTLASSDNTGFSSVVYWDKNNDGALDPNDPVLTELSQLAGGSNGASTAAGLSPQESARLFVKVTAPAGAAIGATDATTLTATISGVINTIAASAPVIASDNTSVISSQVTLSKTHALDANCDGAVETAFTTNTIEAGATPNSCIRYRITATNAGSENITGLTVHDATPSYTRYDNTAAATTTHGTITTPTNGAAGSVQADVGTLLPGESAVMNFGVRINP